MSVLSTGLFCMVTEDTSRGTSIGLQVLAGAGVGIMFSTLYFPVLAPLPVTANAYAMSFLMFLRNLFQVSARTYTNYILIS